MKWRIHIKADTDEEVKEILREYAFILTGLRESRKKWKASNYDVPLRNAMERWEAKADQLIQRYKVFYQEKSK